MKKKKREGRKKSVKVGTKSVKRKGRETEKKVKDNFLVVLIIVLLIILIVYLVYFFEGLGSSKEEISGNELASSAPFLGVLGVLILVITLLIVKRMMQKADEEEGQKLPQIVKKTREAMKENPKLSVNS